VHTYNPQLLFGKGVAEQSAQKAIPVVDGKAPAVAVAAVVVASVTAHRHHHPQAGCP
jgi:hypothetical protein